MCKKLSAVGMAKSQCIISYLAGFVLRDLVLCVLLAVLALAVGATGFGYVHLLEGFDGQRCSV